MVDEVKIRKDMIYTSLIAFLLVEDYEILQRFGEENHAYLKLEMNIIQEYMKMVANQVQKKEKTYVNRF